MTEIALVIAVGKTRGKLSQVLSPIGSQHNAQKDSGRGVLPFTKTNFICGLPLKSSLPTKVGPSAKPNISASSSFKSSYSLDANATRRRRLCCPSTAPECKCLNRTEVNPTASVVLRTHTRVLLVLYLGCLAYTLVGDSKIRAINSC